LLASNKKFGASKQELHNDLVKGKDNYPRTVAGVLKYLQPHTLQTNTDNPSPSPTKKQLETIFLNDGDTFVDEEKQPQKSKPCRLRQEGKYDYKDEHLWSECPRNNYSRNKGKKFNDKGELIMYTVEGFEEELEYNDNDLDAGELISNNDKLDDEFEF